MNKKGAGTNLTWMLISTAAFISVVILLSLAQDQFFSAPGIYQTYATNDSQYSQIYSNINDSRGSLDTTFKSTFSNTNILTQAWNAFTSIITTTIIGVSAIFTFMQFPIILNSIFYNVSTGLNLGSGGQILMWFITFSVTVYVAMKVLKAVRGTIDEP